MSGTALQNARVRRDKVARDRNRALALAEELKKQLDRIDQFIADYELFSAGDQEVDDPVRWESIFRNEVSLPLPRSSLAKPSRNSKKEEVSAASRKLIQEAGVPISRSSLLALLLKEGLVIGGAAPETVLSTMLWRTKSTHGVIHLRNVGYWLKELPFQPASYDPSLDDLIGVEDDAPAGGTDDDDD